MELEKEANLYGWTKALTQTHDDIQCQQITMRKEAEQNMRKIRNGGVPWSPKLQSFRDTIELWDLIYKKKIGVRVSSNKIKRLIVATCETEALTVGRLTALKNCSLAHRAYKDIKKNAEVWRDDFMESLAKSRALRNNTSIEAEEKRIKQEEKQRKSSISIKRMRHKLGRPATTRVYYTNEDGIRVECSQKETVEEACFKENDWRFGQSEGTLPTIEPLLSALGYLGEKDVVEEILDGSYEIPDGVDIYTAKLIQELKMPEVVRQYGIEIPTISTNNHIEWWKRQKEGTASEPEALSFSHYKTGIDNKIVTWFDTKLRELPYKYGFTPVSWRKIVDVEILKKAGVYDIEKMRTIMLLNAEFNMNNKLLGKRMMANGERLKILQREQYGGE